MSTNENIKPWWMPGLRMFAKISGYIIGPIILSLILGKYLDKRFDTSPWIFITLTLIAFIISCSAIWKSLQDYIRKIEKEAQENKKLDSK